MSSKHPAPALPVLRLLTLDYVSLRSSLSGKPPNAISVLLIWAPLRGHHWQVQVARQIEPREVMC